MIKNKSIGEKQSSNLLPLKMLFLSYLKQNQNMNSMSDCHSAINSQIKKLAELIEQNYEQIAYIVGQYNSTGDKHKPSQMMYTIEQEEHGTSERSNQRQQHSKDNKHKIITRKFNQSIGVLQQTHSKFQEIMFMYKNQIKQIAKSLTQQKQMAKKLTRELKQSRGLNREKDKQNKYNKQSRSGSFSKLAGSKAAGPNSCLLVSPLSMNFTGLNKKATMKPAHKQVQSDDEQVRPPPKPFCQQCIKRQKQDQHKERQSKEQKERCKQLSSSVSNLKNQLSRYEEQLTSKQTQLNKLNEQLMRLRQDQNKIQSQQKKKLRYMNTNFRGQKIVLEGQVQALKRKHAQNQQFLSTLQAQNMKLQVQKQSLQQAIKWHMDTISDLRLNFTGGLKQDAQLMRKLKQSEHANKTLYSQISNQQIYVEQFIERLKQIEERNQEDIDKLRIKISDFQAILEQKNQTIVRLKMMGRDQNCALSANSNLMRQNMQGKRQKGDFDTIMNKTRRKDSLNSTVKLVCHNNQGFQQGMVKVLNNKLKDKDFMIEKLQKQNQLLKEQITHSQNQHGRY